MKEDRSFCNCLNGGSVFISHSHKDLPKVRQIRNLLEQRGLDPLCFYMQCLTDEDEIEDLLKREIDARDWFAFMESPNSRQSAWVRKEREYIQKSPDKRILYCKLHEDSPEDIANRIIDRMTVYVCYSERNKEYGRFAAEALGSMDFRVYDRCNGKASLDDCFSQENLNQTEAAIREAANHGCFLYLMTKESSQARIMWKELEYASMYNACIAVAYMGVDPWDIPGSLRYYVRDASWAEIKGDRQTAAVQLASLVGEALLQKG